MRSSSAARKVTALALYRTMGLLVLAVISCSRETMSERDIQREQMRAKADQKRAELQTVAGKYAGQLDTGTTNQPITLTLEIKDIPTPIEGQIDPLLMPTLSGYLQIKVGEASHEFLNYAVQRAEYDPARAKLDLVLADSSSKQVLLALVSDGDKLSGPWTAPEVGISGTVILIRNGDTQPPKTDGLRGIYQGKLVNTHADSNLPERLQISFVTSQDLGKPNGLVVTGGCRFYWGGFDGDEYWETQFSDVRFNPFTGSLVAITKTDEKLIARLTFKGTIEHGLFRGQVHADSSDKIADFEVTRQ